jgi:hypothetical protein
MKTQSPLCKMMMTMRRKRSSIPTSYTHRVLKAHNENIGHISGQKVSGTDMVVAILKQDQGILLPRGCETVVGHSKC